MDVNVSYVMATIVSDFVSQQETIQKSVPLGFSGEINASNIQITTSKIKII